MVSSCPQLGTETKQERDNRCRCFVLCQFVAFKFLGGIYSKFGKKEIFAVEMSMSQGTSLSQMVESCTKAEKLLRAEYPEVK